MTGLDVPLSNVTLASSANDHEASYTTWSLIRVQVQHHQQANQELSNTGQGQTLTSASPPIATLSPPKGQTNGSPTVSSQQSTLQKSGHLFVSQAN
jgi:hypothetical protein